MKQRPAAVAGHTCLIIGILDIASAISPHMQETRIERIAPYVPGLAEEVARAAALAAGLLLVMLARGLRRRKRRAWEAAVGLLAVSALVQGVRHHALIPATVSVVLCVALVAYREEFYALGDPRGRTRALWNLVVLGGSSFGLGLLVVGVRANQEAGHAITFADRVQEVGYGLIGASGPIAYRSDRAGDIVYFSLLALGVVTAATSAYLALRPVTLRRADSDERLRALLADEGRRDSLGYFALRGDKSVLFSPSGKAAVAYRVVSGVALAGGDPIGDHEAWPGAIKEFLRQCALHAWTPAVMGCSELGGQVWIREGGLKALELGDEAIVDCQAFSLSGRTMRNVRQMVNRIERAGYTCRMRRVRDLPDEEKKRLREAAAAWRGSATERGFSMALGRFGDPDDGDCVVVTAHQDDEAGNDRVRALLHFVPWGEDGLSLDLMRRDRTAEPGLNELLIVAALRGAPGLGVRRMSLNFAVFRAALARGERLGAGPVLRVWRGLLVFLSRWFQIESLYRFNAKFRPDWEPRFVVYPTVRDLPRISWACLQAEAFVVLPHPAERLRQSLRKRPAAREEKPQPVKVTTP
ncbi:phosphatidylglycerol lysyltransferase domain-containing protein [Streptomyces sp. NPDC056975]|uniref:phosphatidylglycerol lysyltransferase domain-containing protein n=1 Tax=unclassified Streptomyces TaxID=2593676 RepID=UPI003641428E